MNCKAILFALFLTIASVKAADMSGLLHPKALNQAMQASQLSQQQMKEQAEQAQQQLLDFFGNVPVEVTPELIKARATFVRISEYEGNRLKTILAAVEKSKPEDLMATLDKSLNDLEGAYNEDFFKNLIKAAKEGLEKAKENPAKAKEQAVMMLKEVISHSEAAAKLAKEGKHDLFLSMFPQAMLEEFEKRYPERVTPSYQTYWFIGGGCVVLISAVGAGAFLMMRKKREDVEISASEKMDIKSMP